MTILSDLNSTRWSAAARSRALHYLPATALVLDFVAMTLAGLVAVVGRNHLGIFDDPHNVTQSAKLVAPFVATGWLATIAVLGGYRDDVFGAGTDEFKRVLNGSAVAAALVGVGCYLMKFQLPRGFFVLVFLFGILLLIAGRLLLRRALQTARVRGALQQRVVIAGGAAQVAEIASVLRREKWLGYHLVGALVPDGVAGTETVSGIPVLGDANDRSHVVGLQEIDVIFFTGGSDLAGVDLRRIVWDLEQHATQLVMAPNVTDISGERLRIRPVGGLPLVHLEGPRWAFAARWAKRVFDLIGATVLIVMMAPLLLWAAVRIKLHDRGEVLFRQTRVGRDGREFSCLKFRTMVMDADAMIGQLQEEQGAVAFLFKLKDDPRITKPGRFLRRYSIDELPQLFNVLRGDMSLVGPRPQVPAEVAEYDDIVRRRLRVRPGMTGLWQVSGRNDLSPEDSIRLDLYYIDNWSMMQDLAILCRTFGAVMSSSGAY